MTAIRIADMTPITTGGSRVDQDLSFPIRLSRSFFLTLALGAAVLGAATFTVSSAWAGIEPRVCEVKLSISENLSILEQWAESRPDSEPVKAWKLYRRLITRGEHKALIKRYFPKDEVIAILADDDLPFFSETLHDVLRKAARARSSKGIEAAFQAEWQQWKLLDFPDLFEGRMERLRNREPGSLRPALGDLSLKDVQKWTYGEDYLNPSPKSLIGRYLKESGAKATVRTFQKGPDEGVDASKARGPRRLVVPISHESFPIYLKHFGHFEHLIHLHTPRQGTLKLVHDGKVGSYGNLRHDLEPPEIGSILPHILLKTTEGIRASNFFELAAQNQSWALLPWIHAGYCATGGYSSCTHWVGNIPIGDERVDAYSFPGLVDNHANNSLYPNNRAQDRRPRVQELGPYQSPSELVSRVWKVPGNRQLADVLGLQENNLRGEFANPGWVAIMLTAWASVERVPVVFIMVDDHTQPIPRNYKPQIHAY